VVVHIGDYFAVDHTLAAKGSTSNEKKQPIAMS
jgi:hypothetical protein